MAKAESEGLDLVLVAPKAQPPVAKIIDHGRWKYEQNKLRKENKKKTQEVKGISLRPGTAEHDLQVIVRKATKFLKAGDKVRIVCRFRPRELAHPAVGREKLLMIAESLADLGKRDKDPALSNRDMVMIINPKSTPTGSSDAENQDKQDGS